MLQYKGHALAIGQAADVWKSHERGLLISGIRPWIGYLMIVEETPRTIEPKYLMGGKIVPAGMEVDPTFNGMSYADR